MQEISPFSDRTSEPENPFDEAQLTIRLHAWQRWTSRLSWMFILLGCVGTCKGVMEAFAVSAIYWRMSMILFSALAVGIAINFAALVLPGLFLRSSAGHSHRYLQTGDPAALINSFLAMRRFWIALVILIGLGLIVVLASLSLIVWNP